MKESFFCDGPIETNIKRFLFSEQVIRRSLLSAIRGMNARLRHAGVITPTEKGELDARMKSVKAQLIELDGRYRHYEGRTPEQISFNRDRIRCIIAMLRTIDATIEERSPGFTPPRPETTDLLETAAH